jgi:hypothetical protein
MGSLSPAAVIVNEAGTNIAEVKAASTAAVAADKAVVVAVSPNNIVPTQNAAASQADGHSASIGATSDADTALTVIGRLKNLLSRIPLSLGQKLMAASFAVVLPSDQTVAVTSAPSNATTGANFGRILTTTGAGTLIAVRATPYTEQLVNFTGSIISSSASDSAAGVGVRTVKIYYIDATGATAGTETVTLNGTTSVPLVASTKCFIEKMEVLTWGSTGWNVGTITLRNDAVATVGSIGVGNAIVAGSPANVGHAQTFWGHHYVLAGKTASFYTLTGGTNGNQAGTCFLKAGSPLAAAASELQITEFRQIPALCGESVRQFANAIKVTGFARVTAYVISEGTNTRFSVGFDWSEV